MQSCFKNVTCKEMREECAQSRFTSQHIFTFNGFAGIEIR